MTPSLNLANINWENLRGPDKEHTLYWYDGPILWSSSEGGVLCIWQVLDDDRNKREEIIMGAPVTEQELGWVKESKMFLRDAFEKEKTFLVKLSYDWNLVKFEEIDVRGKDDYLPGAGLMLSLD
jgi:hypothetical protein